MGDSRRNKVERGKGQSQGRQIRTDKIPVYFDVLNPTPAQIGQKSAQQKRVEGSRNYVSGVAGGRKII